MKRPLKVGKGHFFGQRDMSGRQSALFLFQQDGTNQASGGASEES